MNDIELEVPASLNSIKLKDYQKFVKIYEDNGGEASEFLNIKMLEIFCNLKYKDVYELPVGTFDGVLNHLGNIMSSNTPLVKRFSMTGSDNVTADFGFIPNLDKMTMGEYIDLNSYFDDISSMHKAMAVLYRPVHKSFKDKEAYRIAKYEGTERFSEIMKDMPLDVALGARVFFYHLGMKLSSHILNSFSKAQQDKTDSLSEEEKKILQKATDGIHNYTLLQEEMLSELAKRRNLIYTKP
tara:strand:- start:338 stop:1057 length:720 start_codon:yes stop_codon:yes gene_type:complete